MPVPGMPALHSPWPHTASTTSGVESESSRIPCRSGRACPRPATPDSSSFVSRPPAKPRILLNVYVAFLHSDSSSGQVPTSVSSLYNATSPTRVISRAREHRKGARNYKTLHTEQPVGPYHRPIRDATDGLIRKTQSVSRNTHNP